VSAWPLRVDPRPEGRRRLDGRDCAASERDRAFLLSEAARELGRSRNLRLERGTPLGRKRSVRE
jgi:hypothetical protein